jgi:hypothetical protein
MPDYYLGWKTFYFTENDEIILDDDAIGPYEASCFVFFFWILWRGKLKETN